MALIPLNVPPGSFRNGTEYQTGGRWRDMSLVRFYNSVLQAVGGWRLRIATQLTGKARAIKTWRANDSSGWIAIGTETKLYAINANGTLYDITPTGLSAGRADTGGAVGWGTEDYGEQGYGTPRSEGNSALTLEATVWSLDNWGEYLVGVSPDDGKLYEWRLNVSTLPAPVIANAPTNCKALVVSEERFLFAVGSNGNPRKISWCDQENNTLWSPAGTNQAGSQLLQTDGQLLTGMRVSNGTLFLTDTDAHLALYTGPPFVFRFDRVGSGCGLAAPGAVAQIDTGAVWMGRDGFWTYNGAVQSLECPVAEYVYGAINRGQMAKINAHHNAEFGEVWWFYPSDSSNENDRYVLWSYRANTWATGNLARTAGTDTGVFTLPIMVSPTSYVYEHEVGIDYDNAEVFAETGPIEVGNGDNLAVITKLIPDEKTLGDVTVKFKSRLYPTATETTHGPFTMSNPTAVRFTGRQVKMRVIGGTSDWQVGTMRVEASQGSKR